MAAWADFDEADLPAPEPPAPRLTPNQRADLLALAESDDWAPERGITLVEGPRPWGNRYAGPVALWDGIAAPAGVGPPATLGGDGPRQGRRVAGPDHLAELNAGRARRPRPLDGTAWVGAPDDGGPCPLCDDAIAPGSRRYCDRCGSTGHHSALLAQAVAAFARELDLEARGLYVDADGLVAARPRPSAA